jgi:hypothetical protein
MMIGSSAMQGMPRSSSTNRSSTTLKRPHDPRRRCGTVGQVQHLRLDACLRAFRKLRG